MKPIGIFAFAISVASAPAFAQQVYKWVDERGVVNYSSEAPKNREAKKLDPDASRVTIIPAMAPPTIPGSTRSDPAVDERLARLEAQAERERAA